MNFNLFVVCTLIVTGLLLVPSVQGVNLLTIDTFVTGGSATSIIYTITAYGTPTTWYSPYNVATPPQAKFFNTADALGGQRDLILGYVDPVPIGSTAIVNIVSRRASISFPLNWIGGAYFQWDGIDDAGSGTAFPGATLNPGLTAPVDITFNGQATGLALSITSDQDTDYRVTLVNSAGTRNQYRFILLANEPAFSFVPLLYSSSIWSSPGFNFADVRGFEVQIQTGTDTSSNAPDTQFTPLFIFSYAVSGQAFVRCNCGTTSIDQDVVGAQIDLYTAANVFIRSTTTDINGDYTFWNLNPVTYNICYQDTTAQLCTASTARCQSVTIDPLVPAASYTVNFAVTQSTTFTIPADVTGDCGDCKIPDGTSNCPGYAQTTGCLGGVTVVTAFTDVTTGDSCRTNIARTWTSPDDGSTKTQRLTFLDTTPPVFFTPPQDLTQDCDNVITTLADWVNADGFADDGDDCSPFFVSDNWNGLPVGPCNQVTVTFTLQDQCGNVRLPASQATYTLQDNFGPSIDSPALDLTVECAAKTTNVINSLNSWLSRHADAVASDNCASASSISWTNNYAQLTPLNPNSCLDSVDVTFTAHDTCGNTNSDVATFTVQDTTSAVFTTNPQNFNQQCAGTTADNNAFNNWLNNNANARFTDACSTNDRDITISNDFNGATINECSDAIVVNFTLQDFCGNPSVTQAATFTIVDSLPPVFSSFASDLTVECDGFGNQDDFDTWIADNAGARATDACTAVTFSVDQLIAPATPTCRSSLLTTFTASDQCGLSASTQATFTIVDTTAPFFVNFPADSGAECNTGTAQAYLDWLNAEAGATASDLCNPATVIIQDNDPALVLGCNRANVVQFRAVDECLNASPIQTATFTVVDTTPPVITNTGAPLDIECNSATSASDYNTWLLAHAGGDAVDDCTSVFWTNDGGAPITLGCLFTRDVTFTANDQCGFSDFFVQTATITDNTPPVLQNQAVDQDIQCNTISNPTSNDLYASWIAAHGFATATDSCTAITWSDDHIGLVGIDTCFASETVTFTASDACAGHFVQTTATFTVRDTQPPNVIQGAQVTSVECDPNLNGNAFLAWIQNHGNAIVQDACSPLTWTVSLFQTPVGCSSVTVQFTADDGCGSSIVTTGTFNIVDTLPPTFVTTAQNVRIECDGAGNVADYANYLATHGGAVATDVCTTSATWTNNAIGTGPVGCGSETIAFTVTDSCGQRSTTTGTFTIIDSFAPSIFPPAADQSAECDNNSNPIAIATWLIAHGGASATDSCYSTGSLTWTNNFTTLTPLPCGAAATVTFSVSDPCLNTARTTATFRVNDTTPPVITKQAQDLVLECNAATNNQDTLTWVNSRAGASATDSCTTVTWTNNFVATPDPCSGPYVINYYATDQCGNRATTTASVTIIDTVAPTFVDFPEDIQVVCDEITDSSVTGIPGFNDNCLSADVIRSETDAISVQPSERLCPGDTIITRTWKLTDACGNVATKDQLIIVSIPQGPCIPQPCIPCEEQPLLCCASSIAPVPCNPVECTPVDCAHTQCTTVPCLPVVCGNGAPPPFQDDDDTIAPSPRPQASECEPIYIYVFDDDDGVSTQPVYTVSFVSGASSVSFSLFSLILAFLLIFM